MKEVSRVKRIQFQHLLHLAKSIRTMTRLLKNQILQAVKMDGSINFQTNGNINFYPSPWEDEKEATNGERVHYKAGVEVDNDGRTRVKRYNIGARGPKYVKVFETPHGVVKVSKRWKKERPDMQQVIVEFRFPRMYGLALTKALYKEESDDVLSFFNTRKEETIWNR